MRVFAEIGYVLLCVIAFVIHERGADPPMTNWVLERESVAVDAKMTRMPEFAAKLDTAYHVFLKLHDERPSEFRQTECLSGITQGVGCEKFPSTFDAQASVAQGGNPVSLHPPAQRGYINGRDFFRDLGSFDAKAGGLYTTEVQWKSPLGILDEADPELVIQTYPSAWEGEFTSARIQRAFALGLGVIGLTMLWVSLALRGFTWIRNRS